MSTEMIYSEGAIQAAAATASNIRNRNYKTTIDTNSEMATGFAASLMVELDSFLTDLEDDDMKDECAKFLMEQKKRLVKTAEVNVEQHRQIQAFVGGLQRVQQTLLQQGQHQEQDYAQVLAAEIKTAETGAEHLEMHQEQLVRAMQTTLGMKLSAAAGGNESDDDVEVMPTGAAGQGLKCPISMSYFVDPVKSKVCHHVYSKDALRQLLAQNRQRGMPCPISGCVNRHLTMESCEPDRITKQKVARHERNQAAAEEARMSQAVDLDEEEEF